MLPVLTRQEAADLRYYARWRALGFHEEGFGGGACPRVAWSQAILATEERAVAAFARRVNRKAADAAKLAAFRSFRKEALAAIGSLVAPRIAGLEAEKRAAALQLFAQEPFHLLLLGDPGTGKTEILRGVERLAPHAVFGLGSGASKAGLVGMYEGKEFRPGLLVQADEGLALIDELNLLRKEERGALYSAMEKGFLTYDKGGRHERHDARVRVLATANPVGDRFTGRATRAQLPFDEALLSRFHLLFLVRKATGKAFEELTRRIVREDLRELDDGDAAFVREYVAHAEQLNVAFDDKYESMIVDCMEGLRREQGLVEAGPRTVIGLIRIAKAHARSRLARAVSADDVEAAIGLVRDAFAGHIRA